MIRKHTGARPLDRFKTVLLNSSLTLKRVYSCVAALIVLSACASSGVNRSEMGRFSDGMKRLGASQDRAECFANAVGGRLDEDGRERATDIVESAADKEEMRAGVLDAEGDVRRAFIAANMRCSLIQ